MSLTIEEVKKNVAYKRLPIVILDERWHRLFPEKEKTSEIRKLEKNLNELLKRQGQITNDLKALKKIKEAHPQASVIMCSAMGQQAMVIESIQSGAKDFIVKPFQADRVIEAVRKVVG